MALIQCARYRDSSMLVTRQLAEAEKYRLPFVRPEAFALKASAELGLRQFGAALRSLRTVQADALAHDDVRLQMFGHTLLLRIRIAQSAHDRGFQESNVTWRQIPAKAVYGEYLALQALARACAGAIAEAVELADHAERVSYQGETPVLVACVRAICALIDDRRRVSSCVRTVAELVLERGYFDSLVTAYRGFPRLLQAVAPLLGEAIVVALHEARDERIARAVGLDIALPPASLERGPLSRREREVHRLLAQGLTNQEIAEALFISESTAKVHVRNVLRKLNVRSRTEAALLAGERD